MKSVVVDLNSQYIKFIKALFPNARIIIDRFHIVQLVGRTLGNARISLMKKMNDCHCREYKILKAHWRLFYKDSADLEAARSVYLRGVNEYMTQQNALDLIVKNHPQVEKVYDAQTAFVQKGLSCSKNEKMPEKSVADRLFRHLI